MKYNINYLTDKRLSWKAKGIYTFMISFPEDKDIHIDDIRPMSTDGRDGFAAGMNELEKYGYIEKMNLHQSNGKFAGFIYKII